MSVFNVRIRLGWVSHFTFELLRLAMYCRFFVNILILQFFSPNCSVFIRSFRESGAVPEICQTGPGTIHAETGFIEGFYAIFRYVIPSAFKATRPKIARGGAVKKAELYHFAEPFFPL